MQRPAHYLILDQTDPSIVHNWAYVPANDDLLFDLKAETANTSGTLTVPLHLIDGTDVTLGDFDTATQVTDRFEPIIAPLPSNVFGKIATLEFKFAGSGPIDLDNVRFGESGTLHNGGIPEQDFLNSEFNLTVTDLDPSVDLAGWSLHQAGNAELQMLDCLWQLIRFRTSVRWSMIRIRIRACS
jgi:hypothetical protein